MPRVIYPRPAGVADRDVKVVAVTPARMVIWLKEIKAGTRLPEALIAFNEPDFLTVAQWIQELLRHSKAQDAVINAYELEAHQHNDRQDQSPLISTSPE